MNISQSNPKESFDAHKEDIDRAISRVLSSGWYILGKEVEAFENEFASFHGGGQTIGVGNGTDALELSLRAIGLERGELVFTVSHTAVATVAAIERAGGKVVLVDIDPKTHTMDPQSLEDAIIQEKDNGTLGAIVVVHLYGHPADVMSISKIAKSYGMAIVEDCAQAHGAKLEGKIVGSFGDIAAFSFYPTKNLGALGDGGAVLTKNPHFAERVRLLREYGWKKRYISEVPGGNSRLDEIQAAILRVKLKSLQEENNSRRKVACSYFSEIKNPAVALPFVHEGVEHVFHQFVVRSRLRDSLRDHLTRNEVGTLIHYPVPIHRQAAYEGRLALAPGGLSETEKAAQEVLSLPMFPQLTNSQIARVMETVNEWTSQEL